jgi:genome maintenance exonuclease 1
VIRNFEKYNYPHLSRDHTTGRRLYKTPEDSLVPSVTTVLSETKDNKYLKEWQQRIGKDNAERIRKQAASVGTSMHLFLESHVLDKERKCDYSPIHAKSKKMAKVIIENGLKFVDEIWGSEVRLYYKDQYAGTTDVIGLYKGIPHIIDFKQTNKPKKEEWVEDYYLQLCAYAHAHNYVTGSDIQCGVILMCSQDLQFQKFEMNEIAFQKYTYMWFNRMKEYQQLLTEQS